MARRNSSRVFFCRLISYPTWNYRVFGYRRGGARKVARKQALHDQECFQFRAITMGDGRSRPREALQCLLERGDRLLWIKQRIRGGCIRSIQHSVLTTDGARGESPAPFGFTVCLELNFATAGFSSVISHYREGRLIESVEQRKHSKSNSVFAHLWRCFI